jgi:hypothetical protein
MDRFIKIVGIAVCCILFTALGQVYADVVKVGTAKENQVKILSSTADKFVIEYTIGEFAKKAVKIKGDSYQKLSLKKEAWILRKGEPELPKMTRSLAIPNDAKMAATVVEEEFVDIDMRVAPSKGILMRTVNIKSVPYTFSDLYETDAFYPAERFKLGKPYILRDVRGIAVDVYPFAYNPMQQTLRVYTKLVIEVANSGVDTFNNLMGTGTQKVNDQFKGIYENHFLNYKTSSSLLGAVSETGRMIVICYDSYCSTTQPYVDWKISKGIPTQLVPVSTIGNNYTSIKNYIQTEYNKGDGLAFVQLIGDASHVTPYYSGSEAQDPVYSLLAGSDNYPDILIGRFSAQSTTDVQTQVDRSIYYERDMVEASWFHKATNIASDEGAGGGHDGGEADWEHSRNFRTDLLGYHYTTVDELYDGSHGVADASGNPTDSMLSSSLNDGRSLVNYTGHGSTTSFATTGFNNTDVNNLTNQNKLPLVVAVACVVGQFQTTTSFSEAWLRATSGGQPTGAIGFYGSSINQSWQPPMTAQDEIADLMAAQQYQTMGGLLYNGSIRMIDEYGTDGADMFKTWHIFGDASLVFISGSSTGGSYCDSSGGNQSYEYVAGVSFAGMTKTSGAAAYSDFTSTVMSVNRNQSYSIQLTPGFTGSSYQEYWKVWIDYNGNYVFDSNELVVDTQSSSTVNSTVTIPSTAQTGTTRMRVIMSYSAINECGTYTYGETEDYTVNIN